MDVLASAESGLNIHLHFERLQSERRRSCVDEVNEGEGVCVTQLFHLPCESITGPSRGQIRSPVVLLIIYHRAMCVYKYMYLRYIYPYAHI